MAPPGSPSAAVRAADIAAGGAALIGAVASLAAARDRRRPDRHDQRLSVRAAYDRSMRTARNIAIIAVLALPVAFLPAGGEVADAILTALLLGFLAGFALMIYVLYRQNRLTSRPCPTIARALLSAPSACIVLMIAAPTSCSTPAAARHLDRPHRLLGCAIFASTSSRRLARSGRLALGAFCRPFARRAARSVARMAVRPHGARAVNAARRQAELVAVVPLLVLAVVAAAQLAPRRLWRSGPPRAPRGRGRGRRTWAAMPERGARERCPGPLREERRDLATARSPSG